LAHGAQAGGAAATAPGPATAGAVAGTGSAATVGPPAISDKPTRQQLAFYAFVRSVASAFSYVFWRVRVSGRENVPTTGPFILSPVHRSNIDAPLMACVTRRRMRYMGKDAMWKYRFSAWFSRSLGGFPVHRGNVDREALRISEAAVRAGEPVVIFPEGTRRSGPVIGEIFEGAAFVAVRTGTPIIPVGIGGSERAMPKGSKIIRPVKVRVVVGRPIHPPPRADSGRGSRRQVHEVAARLRAELQRLFDEAQAAAGTPNPPRPGQAGVNGSPAGVAGPAPV
jgi:1-acyl-sn-glycerol-3-phosphate acyltransferase